MADEPSTQLVGELLALLAHDLRNPLSALHSNVGFLGSMLDHEDTDAQEAVADALLSCEGLSQIIDSVEMLSHVLCGDQKLNPAPFALAAVVEHAAASSAALAKSHEVVVTVDEASSQSQARVSAHRDMAGKALMALVRNSIQHAPPGSMIRVEVEERPDQCVVVVRDEGTPLAAEALEAAFTAAGQITTKGIRGGRYSRGLGLYCARVCARAAGANVASRKAASGNAFELVLNRER